MSADSSTTKLLSARALSKDERARLAASRLRTTTAAPYLSSVVLAMPAYSVDGLGTLAVDKSARLYIDPVFFADLEPDEAVGVLLHEVSHVIHDHSARAQARHIGRETRERWNVAADLTINDDLVAGGFTLPGGVRCEQWSLPRHKTAELYYDLLAGHGISTSDCGSGATGQPGEWEFGDAGDDDARGGDSTGYGRGLSELDLDLLRRHVAEEIDTYIQRNGAGSVPAGMARFSQEALARPSVPWRDVLRTAVRRPLQIAAGVDDYTFARPNRRRRSGNVILPGTFSVVPHVAVVVDTSGSIRPTELLSFISEIAGMVSQFKIHPRELSIIPCDAGVHGVIGADEVLRDRRLEGGGGTNMGAGIAAANQLRPRPDLLVIFTDGETPWPAKPPPFSVVVALTEAASNEPVPEWATTVQIGALE